ncbi:MAG TPA: FAD-dependent oxidoreductase [Phycisphaerae bacterium]|nr:FAD-dependent oxidoreductase [Phycisphaerae bacterium]
MSRHFIIIGNGAAGFRTAKALRRASPAAQISLFTRERHPFYLRRQLGDFLSGNLTQAELVFQNRNTYRRERIDLFLMTPIAAVHPADHEVVFSSGQRVRYDRLLVATGTEALPLDLPGAALAGVVCFDTLRAAVEAQEAAQGARRAVLLDAGLVALVLAQSLVERGIEVTQLVTGDRYWPEMLDEEASRLVERLLEANGVTIRRHADPKAVIGAAGRAIGVETRTGDILGAELVLYGNRRRPAVAFLEGSGIEVGLGVRVDERLRTSDPDVFAAGDAAEPVPPPPALAPETPFCWQRAWNQGALAAANMLESGAPAGPPAAGAVRLRTEIFGCELAVIGQGHLANGGEVESVRLRDAGGPSSRENLSLQGGPETYHRLVFRAGRIIGATVIGTGEWVPHLERLVAADADRAEVERTLTPAAGALRLPQTFARHCPICAAELVVHHGTPAGARIRCEACSTDLVVCWDAERMWLEVNLP